MPSTRKQKIADIAERRIARLKRSTDEQTRQAGFALAAFLAERRTEGAFYIRFCATPPCHRRALARLWSIEDEWRLFRGICRFFGV